MAETFTLLIGAKRQVTFPARLLELLSLKEGNEVEISVEDGQISLVPMVRVPRHFISPSLLEKMEARRGAKPSDMSLDDFGAWLGTHAKAGAKQAAVEVTAVAAAPAALSRAMPAPKARAKAAAG